MAVASTNSTEKPLKPWACDYGLIGLLVFLGIWHLIERFVPEYISVFKPTHQFGWIVFAFLVLFTVRELPALISERKAEKKRQEQSATKESVLFPQRISQSVRANGEANRLILVTIFVFFLENSLFVHHGHLVGKFVPNATFYVGAYFVCEVFILYRLIRPKKNEDLQALLLMVLGLSIGAHYEAYKTIALALTVFISRWSGRLRLVGVFAYILALRPVALMLSFIITGSLFGFGPPYSEPARYGEIVYSGEPQVISTVDGIYKLTKDGPCACLYREIQLVPGICMRKMMDVQSGGHKPELRKRPDGQVEIFYAKPSTSSKP